MWGLEPQVLEARDATAGLGSRDVSTVILTTDFSSSSRREAGILVLGARPVTRLAKRDAPLSSSDRLLPQRPLDRGPEHLVGIGFRCWLMGYQTGEIACWEQAWTAYSSALGTRDAKRALGDLSHWVRAISHHAQRRIETFPPGCRGFCRDECVAISMIASCQHNACPAMRACAFTLLGCPMIDEVVEGSESFAATLRSASQVLSPASICSMAHLALPVGQIAH